MRSPCTGCTFVVEGVMRCPSCPQWMKAALYPGEVTLDTLAPYRCMGDCGRFFTAEAFCTECFREVQRRKVIQVYHRGYVREAFSDNMEIIPLKDGEPEPWDAYMARWNVGRKTIKERKVKLTTRQKLERDKGLLESGADPSTLTLRARVYAAAGWKCEVCFEEDLGKLTMHHVIHRSRGGGDDEGNLQTVCEECHRYAHMVLRVPSGVRLGPSGRGDEHDTKGMPLFTARRSYKKPPPLVDKKTLNMNLAGPFIARLKKNL